MMSITVILMAVNKWSRELEAQYFDVWTPSGFH
jgi:hypothetical protein